MIIKDEIVKQKLLQGIELVASTVAPTLGPQAKTVILQGNPPVIINDGVTITKYISHEDPYVQMGIQLVQNLASKAQENAGDGTTTACVIAEKLCRNIFLGLEKGEVNLHELRIQLESVRNQVLNDLDEMSNEVTDEEIVNCATIAANNDAEMGALIAEVLSKVGRDGVITVEEGHQLISTYEVKEGLEIDEGYFSHLMANSPAGICELQSPLVLCSNKVITHFNDILPVLELVSSKGKPFLLFCKDIQGPALSNMIMNIAEGRIQGCVVKAPNFGDAQLDELGDIVSLLGGKLFSDENNEDISTALFEDLGQCEKVIVTNATTTLIGGAKDKQVEDKISSLKERYEELDSNYDKLRVKKRISRLQGGVAVIKVGAGSSIEMRENKERLDDALNATKAALEEGVVLGGGMALANIGKQLLAWGEVPLYARDTGNETDSAKMAMFAERIVGSALLAPLSNLLKNGGNSADLDTPKLLSEYISNIAPMEGYNAVQGTWSNLMTDGVIDPVKVTKSSFSVAMSIAMLFLTTDVAVLLPEA